MREHGVAGPDSSRPSPIAIPFCPPSFPFPFFSPVDCANLITRPSSHRDARVARRDEAEQSERRPVEERSND